MVEGSRVSLVVSALNSVVGGGDLWEGVWVEGALIQMLAPADISSACHQPVCPPARLHVYLPGSGPTAPTPLALLI